MNGSSPDKVDTQLARLASGQEGVVALWQICAAGLSARAAQNRAEAGRLHRLFPGVYTVGHPKISPDGWRIGAVLACGEGAVLSRFSAAKAWGILNEDGRRFDVVAPGRSGGRVADQKLIDLRRTRRLSKDDVTALRGIRSRRLAARSSIFPVVLVHGSSREPFTRLR